MLEILAEIEWNKFFLVAQATIVFAVGIVGVFALGIRLLTNAQNAVPGANKGKAAAIRSEVFNRLAAYIAFGICLVALGYGIQLVAPWLFGLDG